MDRGRTPKPTTRVWVVFFLLAGVIAAGLPSCGAQPAAAGNTTTSPPPIATTPVTTQPTTTWPTTTRTTTTRPPTTTVTATPPDTRTVGPQIGKVAPNFSLPALDGGTVSLASLRGRPVMLNFWTTW